MVEFHIKRDMLHVHVPVLRVDACHASPTFNQTSALGHCVPSALCQNLLSADKLLWRCNRRCIWSPSNTTIGQRTAWPAAVPSAKAMRMQMSLMMTRRSLAACWCARAPPAVPSQQGTRASAVGTRASADASLRTCLLMLMTALQGEILFTSLFFLDACLSNVASS